MEKLLACTVLAMAFQWQMSDCQECDDYLISGPRGVTDTQLSASSVYHNEVYFHDAKYGRLYFFLNDTKAGIIAEGWSAGFNNDQQYIQVMFSSVKIVHAILTQGRCRFIWGQRVTSYYVSYSTDGITWSYVKTPDKTTMIFPGNTDQTTVVKNTLPEHVMAKYLRIHPKTWHAHVSLRFDVIGCTVLNEKALQNQMYWTRHPIDVSPTVYQNVRKTIQSFSRNKKSCAMECLKNEQCLMFSFNNEVRKCTGFQSQIYQGEKSTFSKDQYFISLSHLSAYEYEIVESKMFGYKIFTRSTTAESASNKCQKEGARLLTVHDLGQMEYVQSKIKDNLILSKQSRYFVDGSYKDGKWTYSTGIDIPSGLWSPSHPLTTDNNCVTLTLTGLQTHDCKDSLYFICGV